MIQMKRVGKWALGSLLLCSSLLFTACTDDNDNDEYTGDDAYVLTMAIQGTDGTFTYYTTQFEDVMSGSLSALGQGIAQPGYYTYNQIDEQIYCMGGMGENNLVALEKNTDGELEDIGGVTSFDNSISELLKTEDGNLLAVEVANTSDKISFHLMDPETVTITKTVNTAVSSITELSAPAYSGMVQSGDYIYLSFYISDPTTYATNYTDEAQIAVFSYPELEFVKVITDSRTGPIGGFNTKSGLIKDENGDIYALSHSNPANGFSQTTKDGAILRINSGETEFDQDYFFDFEAASNGKNTAHLKYLGDGKAFSLINQDDNSEQSTWSDAPLKAAIVDLYEGTVNYIDGVPEHAGTARKLESTALYDDGSIYLCIPEDVSIYVYKVDVTNYTATKGAEVEANFVAGFFKL